MEDLRTWPTEALEEELKRREDEKRDAELQANRKRWNCVLMNIGDFLEWMEHTKTSCNDDDLNNSWLHPNGYPACRRCFLLNQLAFKTNAESLSADFDVQIELVIHLQENKDE
jgi:hypothetical protein